MYLSLWAHYVADCMCPRCQTACRAERMNLLTSTSLYRLRSLMEREGKLYNRNENRCWNFCLEDMIPIQYFVITWFRFLTALESPLINLSFTFLWTIEWSKLLPCDYSLFFLCRWSVEYVRPSACYIVNKLFAKWLLYIVHRHRSYLAHICP